MRKYKWPSVVIIAIALIYLYLPIVVLMVMGFNESRYNSLPFSFTTQWYEELFQDEVLLQATGNSLIIALITGVACMILGTMFILGHQVMSSGRRQLARSFAMMPMSIPWIIIGLSMLLLIRAGGFNKSLLFLLAGHIVISLPYTLLVLEARVNSMDLSLEDMSLSLGASSWTTFRRVTLPSILPAVIAGGFLSFMISFDNFPVSYFLMPAGFSTLPIEIESSIKFGFTPEINAISTLIIGISLICLAIVGIIMRSSIVSIIGGGKDNG